MKMETICRDKLGVVVTGGAGDMDNEFENTLKGLEAQADVSNELKVRRATAWLIKGPSTAHVKSLANSSSRLSRAIGKGSIKRH